MTRVKNSVTSHQKHKKILARAKGFQGRHRNIVTSARETLLKAGEYAFASRKQKRRTFRRLWITRLSAAVAPFGLNYSQLIKKQAEHKIEIDRKVLSELAISKPEVFAAIIEEIKK